MNNNETNNSECAVSAWGPQFLVALSVLIFLGWQVFVASRQHFALIRMSEQQAVLVNQAAQTESKIQSMMTDLLRLALTDADAKAIATKYRITYNPPRQSALPDSGMSQPDLPLNGRNVPSKASSAQGAK